MMSAKTLAPLFVFAAFAVVLGCDPGGAGKSSVTKAGGGGAISPADQVAGAYEQWPKPPVALVLTGQVDGYLEPCGCSEGQKGGFGRRMDLMEQLTKKGWNLIPLDLGGLAKDPAGARGGPEQAKMKFGVALRALGMMGYKAIALAAEDLRFGTIETLGQLAVRDEKVAVLCANVRPKEGSGFEEMIKPSLVIEANGVKVGVAAVMDGDAFAKLNDPDKATFLEATEAKAALAPVIEELKKSSDVQVLLANVPTDAAKGLAEAFPDFDIVFAGSDIPDPDSEPITLNGGKTRLITVGRKGTNTGLVALYPKEEQAVRYQRVVLDQKFNAAEPIRRLLDEDFQEELKATGVVANFIRRDFTGAPVGSTFIGAESCKGCHQKTYDFWSKTKHAHAFESLVNNPKRIREFDAECISCHVTGFEYNSGWVSKEATPQLMGNQCENCHGPGSKHAADPTNDEFLQAMHREKDAVRNNNACGKCHDEDNSPKFDFEKYWDQIKHNGMDDYSDPKARGAGKS